MGLFGTLIGGGIGFMLGGPLGAIIGGAFGSNIGENPFNGGHPGARRSAGPGFRQGRSASGTSGYRSVGVNPLEAQQVFLVALISLAAKVAKADGAVTPEEVRSFDHFLKENLGMPADERRVAARIFNEARDSTVPAAEFARQLRSVLPGRSDQLRDMIALLMSVAMADGRLHPAEERLIREITLEMGLQERDFEQAKALFRPAATLDTAYAVLGVDPAVDDDTLKKTYRRLAKEYHPDVVTNKGLGEDFQKFAAEKMRAVNDAYDRVNEARGL